MSLGRAKFPCGASLALLPNLAFSSALAQLHLAQHADGASASTAHADERKTADTDADTAAISRVQALRGLVAALLAYPQALQAVLDVVEADLDSLCGAGDTTWRALLSQPLFQRPALASSALARLITIFARRSKELWKDDVVLAWLAKGASIAAAAEGCRGTGTAANVADLHDVFVSPQQAVAAAEAGAATTAIVFGSDSERTAAPPSPAAAAATPAGTQEALAHYAAAIPSDYTDDHTAIAADDLAAMAAEDDNAMAGAMAGGPGADLWPPRA